MEDRFARIKLKSSLLRLLAWETVKYKLIKVLLFGQFVNTRNGWVKIKTFYFFLIFMPILRPKIFLFTEIALIKFVCKLKLSYLESWLNQIALILKTWNQFTLKKKWSPNTRMITTQNKGVLEYLCTSFSTLFIHTQLNADILDLQKSIKLRIKSKIKQLKLQILSKINNSKKYQLSLIIQKAIC